MKCQCGSTIHPIRIKYGYNSCVKCSVAPRVACIPITNHKTGNTIQLVDQGTAEAVYKASRRKGYGTCLR